MQGCKIHRPCIVADLKEGGKMGQIQISEELFFMLMKYHFLDVEEEQAEIKKKLMEKLDAMVRRDLYSQYKTAPTEEQKQKAIQEYLDKRGVPKSFRW